MQQVLSIFLLLITFSTSVIGQKHKGPINWLSLEEADSLYKANPRPMFIDVYTEWCGWCKRMDASTFQNKEIANYLNANFYPVKLDAETKDSILFMGKQYTNSQQLKVKEMMGGLKLELDSMLKNYNSKAKIVREQVTQASSATKFYMDFEKKVISLGSSNDFKSEKKNLKSEFKKAEKPTLISKNDLTAIQDELNSVTENNIESTISNLTKARGKYDKIQADLLNDSETKALDQQIKKKQSELKSFKRRARKTTHDVAIELCRGQLSYPTFILLFADSLKANMPLKGFQKVPDLFAYLSFVGEGIYKTSRDVPGWAEEFKKVYSPEYKVPTDVIKWKSFDEAIEAAKKDGKKIMVHIAHPNSIASNLMDKESFREPITADKINKNFHAVKFMINSKDPITYKGTEFKNVNGLHQLSLALTKNQLSFPHCAFLDAKGNLVMNVPQYFAKSQIDPVLDYFIEEGYLKATYGDWLKTKKQ